MHSVTNADVLRSEGLDLVVIVWSMSAAQGNANGADGLLRRTVHRRMEREIAVSRSRERSWSRLEPGPVARRAMGLRAMAEDRSPRQSTAYEETQRRSAARPCSRPSAGAIAQRQRRLDPESTAAR